MNGPLVNGPAPHGAAGTRRPARLLAAALAGSLSAASPCAAAPASRSPAPLSPARAESADPILRSAALDPSPAKPMGYDDDPNALAPDEAPPSDFRAPEPASETQESPAPDAPGRSLGPLESALLDRLKDGRPLLARLPPREREAMRAFYAIPDFRPVWVADGALTPAGRSVAARLRAAGEDGLDAGAYPVPALRPGMTDAETAEAELKLSAAVVLYARDARGGRIDLAAISKLITPDLDLPAADLVLGQLAVSGEQAGARLQAYNPNQPGYLALKQRLAAIRGTGPAVGGRETIRLPFGPVLTRGMRDPRVPLLRRHFGLPERAAGTLDAGPGEADAYDRDVAEAVAAFQRGRDLPDNGNLTRATVITLAIPDAPRARGGDEAALLSNMERWRWLPRELGPDYILVNVPEYRLRVYRDGTIRDETRVIVGRTETPTPLFSGAMEVAVVNPYWYVPPSIMKTMRGTGGFEVVGRGKTMGLRQPPGPKNALGYIKFLFPNRHAVYLHDTPARHLFSASQRAFSHGCVRVDNPFRLADAVLPDAWTQERLTSLIGKGERTIRLDRKLPVHIAYFTAYIDDHGAYRTLPDIYGYDARVRTALGLSSTGAAVASLPPEPPREVARIAVPAPEPARPTRAARMPRREADRGTVAARYDQRVRRYSNQGYGEPGLWTPAPQSAPRTWW